MVGILPSLFEQPYGTMDIGGSFPQELPELLRRKVMGAGAGNQETAGAEKTHRAQVDFLVAAYGLGQVRFAFDESRGIQNDEVKDFSPPVPFPEVIKNVGHLESGDLRVAALFSQRRGSLDRPAGLINADHVRGPIASGM
jgi:hypothetical protein